MSRQLRTCSCGVKGLGERNALAPGVQRAGGPRSQDAAKDWRCQGPLKKRRCQVLAALLRTHQAQGSSANLHAAAQFAVRYKLAHSVTHLLFLGQLQGSPHALLCAYALCRRCRDCIAVQRRQHRCCMSAQIAQSGCLRIGTGRDGCHYCALRGRRQRWEGPLALCIACASSWRMGCMIQQRTSTHSAPVCTVNSRQK